MDESQAVAPHLRTEEEERTSVVGHALARSMLVMEVRRVFRLRWLMTCAGSGESSIMSGVVVLHTGSLTASWRTALCMPSDVGRVKLGRTDDSSGRFDIREFCT